MSRISIEETRKVMASSLSCTLVRNWSCRKTAGFLNHKTSLLPGMASAIFHPCARVIIPPPAGSGPASVLSRRVKLARQPLGGAAGEGNGDGLAAAGVQALGLGFLDDGAAIAV